MYIRPWSKEAEDILKRLSKDGRAYTKDTKGLPVQFGHRCKDIIHNELLDIATVRNKRERRTWFIIPEDAKVMPTIKRKQQVYQFKRL